MSITTTVRVTRRATFSAAHVLCRPDWSEARNEEVFGQCSTDHGHNYVVEVAVAGPVDRETGMISNLKDIDRVLKREFIDLVDHKHLNRDVDFLRDLVPTAENVALAAFNKLSPHFAPARLVRLRLTETENNAAEVSCE